MKRPAALLVKLDVVKGDVALRPGGRGNRKIVVTQLFPGERESTDLLWQPPEDAGPCPVQLAEDFEVAVFTQETAQDRHYHKRATEIYTVLEGEMDIEIDGTVYSLVRGDIMVVNPGTIHQVQVEGSRFLCSVLTANSGGVADKTVA